MFLELLPSFPLAARAGAQTGAPGSPERGHWDRAVLGQGWQKGSGEDAQGMEELPLRHEQTSLALAQMKRLWALVEAVTERLRKPENPCAEQFSCNYFALHFCFNSVLTLFSGCREHTAETRRVSVKENYFFPSI